MDEEKKVTISEVDIDSETQVPGISSVEKSPKKNGGPITEQLKSKDEYLKQILANSYSGNTKYKFSESKHGCVVENDGAEAQAVMCASNLMNSSFQSANEKHENNLVETASSNNIENETSAENLLLKRNQTETVTDLSDQPSDNDFSILGNDKSSLLADESTFSKPQHLNDSPLQVPFRPDDISSIPYYDEYDQLWERKMDSSTSDVSQLTSLSSLNSNQEEEQAKTPKRWTKFLSYVKYRDSLSSSRIETDNKNNDKDSSISPSPNIPQFLSQTHPEEIIDLAKYHSRLLREASNLLIDLLFDYLAGISKDDNNHDSLSKNNANDPNRVYPPGLSLPASAIGWLATCFYPTGDEEIQFKDEFEEYSGYTCEGITLTERDDQSHLDEESAIFTSSMKMFDRLNLLKYLLSKCVVHIHVTREMWPSDALDDNTTFSEKTVKTSKRRNKSRKYSKLELSNALKFLNYHRDLQIKPRIDMSIFPNTKVFILDGIAPEWVTNLYFVKDQLTLLKMQRGCVYDLVPFLFSGPALYDRDKKLENSFDLSNEMGKLGLSHKSNTKQQQSFDDDEGNCSESDIFIEGLSLDEEYQFYFPSLTHLKLSSCGLGELSGLRGRSRIRGDRGPKENQLSFRDSYSPFDGFVKDKNKQQQKKIPPPLSMLKSLVHLDLSHNELIHASTALAGLSALSMLSTINLSFNRIRSMSESFIMLGNIRILNLNGNFLTNANGLDRLYSLEKLGLAKNKIKYLSEIAGLAKLPELMELDIKDNPLHLKDPSHCRIQVLNLFLASRLSSLNRNFTYRQLQQILPILDSETVENKELLKLRELTFKHYILSPQASFQTHQKPSIPVDQNSSLNVSLDYSNPSESDSLESSLMHDSNIGNLKTQSKPNSGLFLGPTSDVASREVRREINNRRILRCNNTRRVNIREPLSLRKRRSKHRKIGKIKNFEKVKCKVSGDENTCLENYKCVKSSFALHEVIDSISGMSEEDKTEEISVASVSEAIEQMDTLIDDSSQATSLHSPITTKESLEDPETPTRDNKSKSLLLSSEKCSPKQIIKVPDLCEGISKEQPSNESINKNVKEEENNICKKQVDEDVNDKLSGNANEDEIVSYNVTTVDAFDDEKNLESDSAKEESSEDILVTNSITEYEDEEKSSTSDHPKQLNTNPFDTDWASPLCEKPPDDWNDEVSTITSGFLSLGTNRSERSLSLREKVDFDVLEKNSIYDGPESCAELYVANCLEMYLRSFVFRQEITDDTITKDKETSFLSNFPRIQFCEEDRLLMLQSLESTSGVPDYKVNINLHHSFEEHFVSISREEVIACGDSTLFRLPANKKVLRGFHGEIIYDDVRELKMSDSHSILLCLSNSAVYLIKDFDLTNGKNGRDRRFPASIPNDAKFKKAFWPHAYSRHPIECLEKITIGFGFQRLLIEFIHPLGNKTNTENSKCYTYIIFTGTKKRTIELLNSIQSISNDFNLGKTKDIFIDNDDRFLLDAFSEAVSPEPVGTILNYQIVRQKWSKGDREPVRRVCVLTEDSIYLLDEDYFGDGSTITPDSMNPFDEPQIGCVRMKVVDSAPLASVSEVQAAVSDPRLITFVLKPLKKLLRPHRWRLICTDGESAEKLVFDVRNATNSVN